MRVLLSSSFLLLAMVPFATTKAAPSTWHPPQGTTELPLWPQGTVIAPPKLKGPEQVSEVISEASGEHWMMLQNVAAPTLTVFPPKGPATGTAVMVVPGGGYRVLAMDLEGSEICGWLTAQGITCALLKYRVPASGPNWDPECNCRDIPKVPMALQDAQRAMGLLRAQAERWSINPKRIGAIGFSAGGHVVAGLSTHALRSYTAEQVVFSAAALGTQKLLHRLKATGDLPGVSDRLGVLTRTNSESILGALAPDLSTDYSKGVAITSSWHPDPVTHIEPVRYGKGSNAMALMQTVLTDGGGPGPRWQTWLKELWRERRNVLDLYDMKHWSERTVIALVMQTLDNSITTFPKRTPFGWRLSSKQGHGAPNPTWIPIANEATRRIAAMIGGKPGGTVGEPFNRPLTAHFIGGCTIGESSETGVVDPYQRMFGHPGLHVVDGSAISANLGVNPSLTITAQAERAMAFWPNKGEADSRPPLGASYERVAAVAPRRPAVPAEAPAALRLPIVGVS